MKPILGKSDTNINAELGYSMHKAYNSLVSTTLHYHDYYEFFLTMSDNVIHLINGKREILSAKSLVFIRKNDVHCYQNGEKEFSFINLTFLPELIDQLRVYYGSTADCILDAEMPPVLQLNDSEYNHILNRFNSLNIIDFHDKQKHRTKMKMLVSELFALFIDHELEKADSTLPAWFAELINTAKKPEHLGMTLEAMAKETGMSREHIARNFQKHLQTTASRFMLEQKLNYSANLLLNTNLSILDICYEGRFQAPCWFYQKFKEKFGVTPKEFRNRAKNWKDTFEQKNAQSE